MTSLSPPLRTSRNPSQEPIATVSFTLDGRSLSAYPGETLLQAAQRQGIEIPHLCYQKGLRADGNCRACVVEIKGERVLAPSCCRMPTQGMVVESESARARHSQKLVLELLKSDMPAQRSYKVDDELEHWADRLGVQKARFARREQPVTDASHPAMTVNLEACIQCTRCVRACREVQVNDVIGYALRGAQSKIVFDLDDPMGESSCVGCGECVQACPTGALAPAHRVAEQSADRQIDSVCPYCGVGCQLTYHVKNEHIIKVEGRAGPANHGRLCVKGRFGFDYVHHRERLTQPLIRRDDAPKDAESRCEPQRWREFFREASWDEALARAGGGLAAIRDSRGARALAGFGSAKGSNEEAYLFQKLVRTGFRSNNVDHCTRLCHASSVAALLEGIGSGAVSNPVMDVTAADLVLVIGANPTVNHPVAATFIKNAIKAGTRLVIADPRRSDLSRHAWRMLQFKPDTDVALLNAMMHTIVEEGLTDEKFIADRTSGFEALRDNVKAYSPEAMGPICGIAPAIIREVARAYATSKASMILWGMGISQHIHGTDNARCLIALALMTGQLGRPGTGLHPLRGQNNVQGASDAGLIPMMFPDYQRVDSPEANARWQKLWGVALDTEPGLTVVEVIHAIDRQELHGMYIMGENPAMSDPDAAHARAALASLELLVVQDIFMTETAWLADVILPASAFPEKTGSFTNTDRMVQMGRQALSPPGNAKQDLWIIIEMAKALGLDWSYTEPREVFEEMRLGMDSIRGISWQRLERESSVTYPCVDEQDPGQAIVFRDDFPTDSGRARFVPADIIAADEQPDAAFPFILITGRQLEHWHTGSMTRRAGVLDALEPGATASFHPADLRRLGVLPGEHVQIASRRGAIEIAARVDEGTPEGAVFVPFAFYEAAANLLTNAALDPFGKIPEFKYCAVRVTPESS
jgi:formate dehydrogenase major subunit